MVFSMTGFGKAEVTKHGWNVKVELKSVNNRYLDLVVRLPKSFYILEDPVRKLVQENFARGRIEIFVKLKDLDEKERTVKIDKGILRGFLHELEKIQLDLDSIQSVTLDQILQIPEILSIDEPAIEWKTLTQVVLEAIEIAVLQLKEMRQQEGDKLKSDILHKLDRIEHLIQSIQEYAPLVVKQYQSRLQERLSELLGGTNLSEERFATEVAIFADRSNIDEEIVRLHSHTQQFHQSLEQSKPVGRKLDFLLQEMNRETNTIGSKANHGKISSLVVDLKSELEMVREQVQNIE